MNKTRIFFSAMISIAFCYLGATQTDNSPTSNTIVTEVENVLRSDDIQECLKDSFSEQLRAIAAMGYLEEAISQETLPENQENILRVFFSTLNASYAANRLIPLSHKRAPRLHAILNDLSVKCGIAKPLICLSTSFCNDNCISLFCGLDTSISCIIIGYKCLQALSTDAAIKVVLARAVGTEKNIISEDKKYLKTFYLYALMSILASCLTCFLKENSTFLIRNTVNWLVPLSSGLSAGTFLIMLYNIIMRYMLLFRGLGIKGEIYADQAALELTADPDAFIKAMTSLHGLIAANTPKMEQDAQFLSNHLSTLKNNTNNKQIELLQNLLNQQILEFKNDPQHPAFADRIAMAKKWKVDHADTALVNVKNIKE